MRYLTFFGFTFPCSVFVEGFGLVYLLLLLDIFFVCWLVECGRKLLKLVAVVFIYSLEMDKDVSQPEEKDKHITIRNSVSLRKYYMNVYTFCNQQSFILAFTF
jgi:hypothetical protein